VTEEFRLTAHDLVQPRRNYKYPTRHMGLGILNGIVHKKIMDVPVEVDCLS